MVSCHNGGRFSNNVQQSVRLRGISVNATSSSTRIRRGGLKAIADHRQSGRRILVVLSCLALGQISPAEGQEAIRMSLAGASAAEGLSAATANPGFYNLQLGQTLWRVGTGMGFRFDDNINLVPQNREWDMILSPRMDARVLWPLSDWQSLSLNLGGGYSAYLEHSSMNRPFITPNSELAFNMFAGDFRINLHDRFSLDETAFLDSTVAGNGGLAQFQNTVGLNVIWDLNKVILKAGYDHADYTAVNGGNGLPDRSSDTFSISAGYSILPAMVAGLEAGGGLLQNANPGTNAAFSSASQWNLGPFIQTRITDHINFSLHAGYTANQPEAIGSAQPLADFNGFYAQAALEHRVNQFLDYNISGGHSLDSNVYGGYVELEKVDFSANWKIFHKISLITGFDWQHGRQVDTGLAETFDHFGPVVELGRAVTEKWSGKVSYRHLQRNSDVAGRDYTVNEVFLQFVRQF